MDGYIGGKFYNIDNFAYIIADNGAVMDGGTVVGWYDGEVIHRNLEGKDYSLLENLVKVGKEQGA